MSQTVRCLQCSAAFVVPAIVTGNIVACPHCDATQVVAENNAPASVKPPLTDDDVLAFLGLAPKAPPRSKN